MERLTLTSIDGVVLDAALHPAAGTAVYVHGITADLDEFGTAIRFAERCDSAGLTVLRFSFRGHGDSGGTQRGTTVAGEMLDLQSVVAYAARLPGPVSIVASSFGAVATSLSLPWLNDRLHRLVYLRPVLDVHRTFVEPETPWGRENYSPSQRSLLAKQGFITVNGTFELGRVLFEELRHLDPMASFLASTVPTLIVQGDRDTIVSADIARWTASARPNCELHLVPGADHGFESADHETEAIAAAIAWLTAS